MELVTRISIGGVICSSSEGADEERSTLFDAEEPAEASIPCSSENLFKVGQFPLLFYILCQIYIRRLEFQMEERRIPVSGEQRPYHRRGSGFEDINFLFATEKDCSS